MNTDPNAGTYWVTSNQNTITGTFYYNNIGVMVPSNMGGTTSGVQTIYNPTWTGGVGQVQNMGQMITGSFPANPVSDSSVLTPEQRSKLLNRILASNKVWIQTQLDSSSGFSVGTITINDWQPPASASMEWKDSLDLFEGIIHPIDFVRLTETFATMLTMLNIRVILDGKEYDIPGLE